MVGFLSGMDGLLCRGLSMEIVNVIESDYVKAKVRTKRVGCLDKRGAAQIAICMNERNSKFPNLYP